MLQLASDLSLPLDAVTEAFGVLGVRGSGKTFTAKVLVEELTKAGMPVAILDPLGVHWGLRSSADGERPGLPFVIFGGDHADVPLSDSSGEVIADFVIAERTPVVLDMGLMRKAEMRRFATAFLSRLYHKNRQPLHLVVDEADLFAPQRVDDPTLLGAMEDIVRRGRSKGLGCTLITQRPAVIAKDVLTQISTLIAMRLAGPQDRKALDEWVRANGTEEERAEFLGSLASLPTGTAWVWSPQWLGIFQKVKVRPLETFDSSATPKSGEVLITPRAFAEVDLAALRSQIEATVEKAKAEDPAELRRELADVRSQMTALRRRNTQLETDVQRVKVAPARQELRPIIPHGTTAALDRLRRMVPKLNAIIGEFERAIESVAETDGEIHTEIHGPSTVKREAELVASVKRASANGVAVIERPQAPTRQLAQDRKLTDAVKHEGISAPQQRILDALAAFEAFGIPQPIRSHVALFADQSPSSSGYRANVSKLSSLGLIAYPGSGQLALTDEGRAMASAAPRFVSSEDLQAAWFQRLSRPQAAMLRILIDRYPRSVEREQFAVESGQSPTSSGYRANLSHLHSLGLVGYPSSGLVVASSLLFLEG
jgi:uncharacterized protein